MGVNLILHIVKDEIYAVLKGQGRLELGNQSEMRVHLLSEGDAVHLPAGVIHRLIAGQEGIVIVEASTPEINDIIRMEDAYNRQVNPDFDVHSYREIIIGSASKA